MGELRPSLPPSGVRAARLGGGTGERTGRGDVGASGDALSGVAVLFITTTTTTIRMPPQLPGCPWHPFPNSPFDQLPVSYYLYHMYTWRNSTEPHSHNNTRMELVIIMDNTYDSLDSGTESCDHAWGTVNHHCRAAHRSHGIDPPSSFPRRRCPYALS